MPSKPIQLTNEFTPGMRTLPADDLEAMRQTLVGLSEPAGMGYPYVLDAFLGKIDATGQVDYTDERYWVIRHSVDAGLTTDPIATTALAAGHPRYRQITATNLAELVAGSHSLASGTYVWVLKIRDASTPPVERFFFTHRPMGWTKICPDVNLDALIHDGTWDELTYDCPGVETDAGVVTGRARLLCAFSIDGAGNAVAFTVPQGISLAINREPAGSQPGSLSSEAQEANPAASLYVQLSWITQTWVPATVTWATKPTISDSNIPCELTPINGGHYAGSIHSFNGTPQPTARYGIAIDLEYDVINETGGMRGLLYRAIPEGARPFVWYLMHGSTL